MKNISRYVFLFILIFTLGFCSEKKNANIVKEDKTKEYIKEEEEVAIPEKKQNEDNKNTEKLENTERTKNISVDGTIEEDIKTIPAVSDVPKKKPGPDEEGVITYFEGDLTITRSGKDLTEDEIDIGTGIQNYDFISTGEDSSVEIDILSSRCPDTVITISENSSFSFEINKIEGKESTAFNLFTGSIALKVASLSSGQELSVNTGESHMGVRGTVFNVSTLPSGDTLITCKQGNVECRDETDKKVYAKPGKVVEKGGSGIALTEIEVSVSEVDIFKENWYEEKVRLLKNDALAQIKKNVTEYEKRISQFNEAYTNLFLEKEIIDRWIGEDKQGKIGSNMEIMKDKKKIIGHIYKIQKVLFWFEQVYFRLIQLKHFHDKGFGVGEIRKGLTTTGFFNNLSNENLQDKFAKIRYIYKLYAKRNYGSVPVSGAAGSIIESDDDFFGDEEDDDFFGDDDF